MELEAIKRFLGKYVNLEYHNGFNLYGVIKQVYTETILFETTQAESLINIQEIKNVVAQNGCDKI